MNQSHVVSARFPYLPLHLEVRHRVADVEALLDTGFDGDVIVPSHLVTNGQAPNGHLRWELADGSRVLAPYYLGMVRIGTLGPYPVVVTALGDEPMVGRKLIERFTVILDHGQRLIVER